MLKIVQAPAPVLTKGVRRVVKIDKKIQKLVYDMEETLIAQVDPQGVGLAAPQIGVDLAIFIIKPTLNADTEVFINPKILEIKSPAAPKKKDSKSEKDKSEDIKLEGCLSIPRIWGPVSRNEKVLLEYQDLTGEKHTEWFSGFKAVIVQHETDHLHGVLFTQRVLEQKGRLYEEKDGELEAIT
jgi:peptide deformylase